MDVAFIIIAFWFVVTAIVIAIQFHEERKDRG